MPQGRRPLRVLIEVVHPADVLFFLNPIRQLRAAGHDLRIASRDKDVTLDLLRELELSSRCLSRAGKGLPGLALELLLRDIALLRFAREFRPDVMCGFGGVALSHVGRLLGIPAIGFYDTDHAVLQQRLTLPFIGWQYVPEVYDGPIARGRTTRFAGVKELSYLHPDNFQADRRRAEAVGLDPRARNFLVRVVSWNANHDVGARGWGSAKLRAVVEHLAARGRVHLSAEGELPAEFEALRYRGGTSDFHHLLAHCDLYVGESATIATEAFVLGVPAIYGVDDRRCYIDALIRDRLLVNVTAAETGPLVAAIDSCLSGDLEAWRQRRERWLQAHDNLAPYIVDAILQHGYRRRLPDAVAA
ncbi:MAG: DUF354 domain-containing protein [Pseudohaliea sp.]